MSNKDDFREYISSFVSEREDEITGMLNDYVPYSKIKDKVEALQEEVDKKLSSTDLAILHDLRSLIEFRMRLESEYIYIIGLQDYFTFSNYSGESHIDEILSFHLTYGIPPYNQ